MKNIHNKRKKIDIISIPIILFISMVPVLVRMVENHYPNYRLLWSDNSPIYIDLFSTIKGYAIIISALIAFILFLFYRENIKISLNNKYDKMLFSVAIFTLISTILSKHKAVALWGYKGRAEGIFVIIAYLFMSYYISKFCMEKKRIKYFVCGIFVIGSILSLFGVLQLNGLNPFSFEWYQKIILKSGYSGADLNMSFGDSRVYMTLFNPNYVGSFVAIIFAVAINFILRSNSIIKKTFWLILAVLLLISLYGSLSEAGFIGIICSLFATICINYKYIFKYKIKSIMFCIIVSILIFNLPIIANKTKILNSSLKNSFKSITSRKNQKLDILETNKNFLKIKYNNEKIVFAVNITKPNEFILIDSTGEEFELKFDEKNKYYYPINKKLAGIKIYPKIINKLTGYIIRFENKTYRFVFAKKRIWYLNNLDRAVSLKAVESIEITKGYEHLGSGRVYIWSRSIPLMKKAFLLGFGPDNFVYEFPQMDYVGKNQNYLSLVNTIVDKPHNMYLQYAINIGVIPLLILLGFWFMLLYELFIIVKKDELDDIYITVAAAAFSSIIGFMAVGMFNDSTVNVSSIFWGIVGLGLAVVNYNRYDKVRFIKNK